MKYCSKCRTEFAEDLERCPKDGEALIGVTSDLDIPLKDTAAAVLGGIGPPESTSEIANEVEGVLFDIVKDALFKSCPKCRSSFGGDLEFCPEDGARLSEHSVLARDRLLKSATVSLEEGAKPPPRPGAGNGVAPTAPPDAKGGANRTMDLVEPALELKKYCPKCKKRFPLSQKTCGSCGSALLIPTLGGSTVQDRSGEYKDTLIADKYRIMDEIGGGGFGKVFLAKHESLGKRFAVKVLRGRISDMASFRDRFHEEALKLSRLEDENIVKVIDFGEWSDFQYMVTEFVEGKELSSIIYDEKADALRAAKIMRQVAAALEEAHSKKIVHLDLKPANILVSQKRGRDLVKVIDFGIAEIYSESSGKRQKNITGTCTYMAPEQWRRDLLDPRTDIYSFGVIFYEFLAGRPPFRGEKTAELEQAHLSALPAPLRKIRPDVPAEIEKLVHRCLEKDPGKRFRSAEELEAAIDGYVRRTENVLGKWVRRAGAAAAAILLLATGFWGTWDLLRDKEAPHWVTWETAGQGIEKVSESSTSKRYETRLDEVDVLLEAGDDREVSRLIANSMPYEGPKAQIKLDLLKNPLLTAQAFDGAGNSTDEIRITFVRLPPVSVKARLDKLLPYTNRESVEVEIEAVEGGKARILCRNSGEDLEIEKAGSYTVRLKDGKNLIQVLSRDPESLVAEKTVEFHRSPLFLEASVKTEETSVQELLPRKEWISSKGEIKIEVQMKGSRERLPENALLNYRLNGGKQIPLVWKTEEAVRTFIVSPLKEGRNEISIEPISDRYGNESEASKLVVVLDQKAPYLKDLVKEIKYYGEELPIVRFKLIEEHPAGKGGIQLLYYPVSRFGKSEKPLGGGPFKLSPAADGSWELQLLNKDLSKDGLHEFNLVVKDLPGNSTSAQFTVRSLHSAPKIEILRESLGRSFKRNDTLDLSVDVEDAFPQTLKVRARFSGVAPGSKYTTPSPLDSDPGGKVWKASFSLRKGELEKPAEFDTVRPGFDLIVEAENESGRKSPEEKIRLNWVWENGDRLLWKNDGKEIAILVYHEACPRMEVKEAFWIQKDEVSNRAFSLFPGARGSRSGQPGSPASGMTVDEAKAYARWAGLELPLRSQWIVAAYWDYDEKMERRFPGGNDWPDKKATPFGLEHMLGSVWEIVIDDGTREPMAVGGGSDTPDEVFKSKSEAHKSYLRGKPIPQGKSSKNLGFRCALIDKKDGG